MTAPDLTLTTKPEGNTPPVAIELTNISKAFGPVQANDQVNLRVEKGTIHGIIGENGAGKSTLMSILYGFYEADTGDIHVDGKRLKIKNSSEAIAAGIGMVHQHFMLVDNFTVLENIMLGAESGALLKGSIKDARAQLKALDEEYGLSVDMDSPVEDLPVGEQQRVEILKALYRGADILILDEPTGVLTPQEADQLFRILNALKSRGVTVMLITHKLREIMDITDNVSVMRAGTMVAHRTTSQTNSEELAELMVGRKVSVRTEKKAASAGDVMLSVKNINVIDAQNVPRVDNVTFSVRAGEIVAIAGVSGNGQSELLEVLSGITHPTSGQIHIKDTIIPYNHAFNAADFRDMGIGHVPEDRHRLGMITSFSAQESAILGHHNDEYYNGSFLSKPGKIKNTCARLMDDFDVRPRDPNLKSANFSGGNQQKLILAREMDREPDILLIGQPTRGVDIGAIEFIHQQIVRRRDEGAAILLISVELDEILSLADRIMVMFEGRVVGELPIEKADERILGLMMADAHDDYHY